jgi:Mg-chelatase subunit ChlI
MAPHLTPAELDFIQEKHNAGKTPIQIHSMLVSLRKRKKMLAPHLTKVRMALKGNTYKRSVVETRGRKLALSRHTVLKMNRARKTLLKKRKGQSEVRWADVAKAARAPKVHRTTAKKAFARENIPVAARRPREKPNRSKEHKDERVEIGKKLAKRPATFYSNKLD